jgi:SAM-dependent methyltransferase
MKRPPNFDRVAGVYRWMEWASFGPWLGWCRCAFLAEISACRRGLVLGDGDGRFTARLLAANPAIQIEAIDASPAMLESLVRRADANAGRVRTLLADAREWEPGATTADLPFDLIATHFFLDCLTTEEVRSLATKLRRIASPSALWVVSEFAVPSNLFGHVVARPMVRLLYQAFAALTGLSVRTLPDHAAALREGGFCLQQQRTLLGGLLSSELWSVGSIETEPAPKGAPLSMPVFRGLKAPAPSV